MADVILIRPRSARPEHARFSSEPRPPSGLIYLAAPLVGAGFDVLILDQIMDPEWERKLLEGLNERTLCVGVTALTGYMIDSGIAIAQLVRQHAACPIVWGGVHATLDPVTTIRSEHVDIAVLGEGEETILELVQALRDETPLSAVDGIIYMQDGAARRTGTRAVYDLNRLPPLPFHLANLELYRWDPHLLSFFNFHTDLGVALETSRGCTHRCTYCIMASPENEERARWRGMSAEKMADAVEQLVRDHGVGGIAFSEDNFFVDVERVERFLDEIERRRLRFEWFADVRMDTIVKKMDVPLLKRLERAGLRSLGIGIESGSERVLKMIRKGETRDTFLQANRMLAHTSVVLRYGYLQGLPGETAADVSQTYELAAQMLTDNPNSAHGLNKLLPTPGTPIFDECVRRGLRPPTRLEDWSSLCDTDWRAGPAVWMDAGAAQRIMDLFFFNLVATWENPALRSGGLQRAVVKAATALLLFRVRRSFYALPVERLCSSLLMKQPVMERARAIVGGLERRRARRLADDGKGC